METFLTRPKDGQPQFSETQSILFRKELKKHEGRQIAIHIDPREPKRSVQQNRFYWFYLGVLSEDLGYTKNELHALFKGMFLTEEVKEVMGKNVRITKSTTDLTKSEFAELIMDIEAQTGIPAPAVEDWGLAPMYLENND